jgi:hypothetical protein
MPPLSYFFWFLMLLWLIFGPGYGFAVDAPNRRIVAGSNFLLFILFAIIGLKIFWVAGGR